MRAECVAQDAVAPSKRQSDRAEEAVTVVTARSSCSNDVDSLELSNKQMPSETLMQFRDNRRGVASEARAQPFTRISTCHSDIRHFPSRFFCFRVCVFSICGTLIVFVVNGVVSVLGCGVLFHLFPFVVPEPFWIW